MTKKIFSNATPWWFLLLVVLIVIFIGMIIGRYTAVGRALESKGSVLVWPLQAAVSKPMTALKSFAQELQSHQALINQNQQLAQQNFKLKVALQRLTSLKQQNQQLQHLLLSSQEVDGKIKVAHILAINLNPLLHQLVIDQGQAAHLYKHQPVLDAYGVMGQVVNVSPKVAKVLLITDKNSVVPVKDERSGVRGLVAGAGNGALSLINITDTADIKPGDLLITSGLGMQFPFGYPVGVVKSVDHTSHQNFAKIAVKPSAHLDRSDQVLLVWPKQADLAQAVKAELNTPIMHPK